MTVLGDKIIKLRKQGMSFNAIADAIPCSLGAVHYTLTDGAKEAAIERNRRRRRQRSREVKASHGGACVVCGYDKCTEALEFDHLNPAEKSFSVSSVRGKIAEALKESEKCILLCCRCHRERHAGLLDIGAYLEPDL